MPDSSSNICKVMIMPSGILYFKLELFNLFSALRWKIKFSLFKLKWHSFLSFCQKHPSRLRFTKVYYYHDFSLLAEFLMKKCNSKTFKVEFQTWGSKNIPVWFTDQYSEIPFGSWVANVTCSGLLWNSINSDGNLKSLRGR